MSRPGRFTLITLVLTMLATVTALAAMDPTGQWQGQDVSLELAPDSAGTGRYEGVLSFQGTVYPAQGRVQGEQFQGQFEVQGAPFEFTLINDGPGIRLESGGQRYQLQRAGGPPPAANPLAQPTPSATPPTPAPVISNSIPDLGAPRVNPKREWTILLYLDGDNNLEGPALGDLNELEAVSGNEAVEVLVLLDRAEGYSDADGDWTGTRLYRVTPGRDPGVIESEMVIDLGELDMSDPETLSQAIARVFPTWPASKRALIMWDHGGGWTQHSMDDGTGGDAHMSLVETREGIEQGLADANMESLDLIGFDMCLMGQLEVAVELQDTAGVMVFSEEIEPGNGWPYDVIIPKFAAGTMGARRLSQEIVQAYDAFYREQKKQGVTQSAVDLQAAAEVSRALDALVEKLGPSMETHWPDVARTIFWSRSYGGSLSLAPGATASYDLMNVLQRLKFAMGDQFPADQEYNELVQAMDQFVIASSVSSPDSGTHGVAIYAPIRANMLDQSYGFTRMGQSSWMKHLQSLHQSQAANDVEPVISNVRLEDLNGKQLSAVERTRGHGIHFDVQGTNILFGQMWDLLPTTDGKQAITSKSVFNPVEYANERDRYEQMDMESLELLTMKFADGSNEVRLPYNGLMFQVAAGDQIILATVDMVETVSPDTICVPMVLEHPEIGKIGGTVAFNQLTWTPELVVLEIPQADDTYVLTSIDPPADAMITWLVRVVDPRDGSGEWRVGGETRWGDGAELVVTAHEPGERQMALFVETIGGVETSEVITYEVASSKEVDERRKMVRDLLTPGTILGSWRSLDMQEYGAGRIVEGPIELIFEAIPEMEHYYHSRLRSVQAEPGSLPEIHQVAMFDTRGDPVLRWWTLEGERLAALQVLLVNLDVTQDQRLILQIQNPESELIYAYVQDAPRSPGGGGAANSSPSASGAGTGQVVQAMQGTWATSDGMGALQVEGNQYEMYVSDGFGGWEVVDGGQFTVQGNTLNITTFEGEQTQVEFQVDASNLAIDDGTGALVFQRVE